MLVSLHTWTHASHATVKGENALDVPHIPGRWFDERRNVVDLNLEDASVEIQVILDGFVLRLEAHCVRKSGTRYGRVVLVKELRVPLSISLPIVVGQALRMQIRTEVALGPYGHGGAGWLACACTCFR